MEDLVRQSLVTGVISASVLSLSITSLGEAPITEPGRTYVSQIVPGATIENARSLIENTTFNHPWVGQFTLDLQINPDPPVKRLGWYTPKGELVFETPQGYNITANEFSSRGWFQISQTATVGAIWSGSGDIEFEGAWSSLGLIVTIGPKSKCCAFALP